MQAAASSPEAAKSAANSPAYKSAVKSIVRADSRSGRLVRATVVQASAQHPLAPAHVVEMIDRIAAEQGVEGSLVHSVARAESNYDPFAISPKGAEGIMQLEPETARRFGVRNSFDPEENVRGGVKYLRFLLNYYHGDYTKTVAAYNAGERAVDHYKGTPPYTETRNYVSRVAKNLSSARQSRGNEGAKKSPVASAASASAETYRPIRTSVGSDGRIYYRTP